MTKLIPLTQGQFAIIDDEDYEELSKYKWAIAKKPRMKTLYAERRITYSKNKYGHITMHRHILGLNRGDAEQVDHINNNGLDNRRCNLRISSQSQNMINVGLISKNTSGYKGVSWHKQAEKWRVRININKKEMSLGLFTDKIEAAKAYDKKAKELFGDFAVLNFPE